MGNEDEDDDNLDDDDENESAHPTRSAARFNNDVLMENNDQCCVCFCTYEEDQLEGTGFQWVKCACQRWVHEDCDSEVLTDKHVYGRELLSVLCVIIITIWHSECM